MKHFRFFTMAFLVSILSSAAQAAEDYVLTLKDHQFSPTELSIPADQKVKITIRNEDLTPAEFESYDLHREKAIAPNGKIIVFIGPLKPGTYKFYDEFHQDKAKGVIKVQ